MKVPRLKFSLNIAGLILGMTLGGRADVVHLNNGRAVNCELIKWDDAQAVIRYMVPNPLGGAGTPAERPVPWSEIASIDFAAIPAEAETMRKAMAADNPEMLLELWGKKKSLLARPNSNAGEIGLSYASLLATKPDAPRQLRALEAFQVIEDSDWNATRKGLARLARVNLWIRQGKLNEAESAIRTLMEESEDPVLQLEAHQTLAKTGKAKLKALESAHPKWEEEDDIKPQRMEMFQSVRDALLYTLLFHGADEARAARSLWELVEFLDSLKEGEQAEIYARDITKLYPGMAEAELATKWLAKRKS